MHARLNILPGASIALAAAAAIAGVMPVGNGPIILDRLKRGEDFGDLLGDENALMQLLMDQRGLTDIVALQSPDQDMDFLTALDLIDTPRREVGVRRKIAVIRETIRSKSGTHKHDREIVRRKRQEERIAANRSRRAART